MNDRRYILLAMVWALGLCLWGRAEGVRTTGTPQPENGVPFNETRRVRADFQAGNDTPKIDVKQLDPVGSLHIPIGIPNSLDSLKTFVEAEGNFSPGIGSYGIYYWLYDPEKQSLVAPTFDHVPFTYGLVEGHLMIPWAQWNAGSVRVRTEVCAVKQKHAVGEVYLTGTRAHLTHAGSAPKKVSLFVALRPLGAAGYDVPQLTVSACGDALLVKGYPAVVANTQPAAAGVLPTDTVGELALQGTIPATQAAASAQGDCSGMLRFDLVLPAHGSKTVGLVCPVHPGQRAVRHRWEARPKNFIDTAVPKSDANGLDMPDLGLAAYRKIKADALFSQARSEWSRFYGRVTLNLPDRRWTNGFYAMLGHAGLCMNEGAADVAVLNYTVFNRDGMYIANMMQKAGLPDLSERVIDYFLAQPFNGRPFPESDNPGQVLWSIGQHWKLTGDRDWLRRIYPAAQKLAAMIEYYRTTSGPFWVNLNSLSFGEALPENKRMKLEPGRCDGFHPEYTEAFDIVGLRVVAECAEALGQDKQAQKWQQLAEDLFEQYDRCFGQDLGKAYGSYSVLWPCYLYPLDEGKAYEQFRGIGKRDLHSWRYFAPATAHQGLLAGNRQAGYATVDLHLDHPQMRDWFAFDEGGRSGSGGWHHLRTPWTHSKTHPDRNHAVAMPHGWAIAEVWLLMRDSLVYEQGDQLVLLAGVSPDWFRDARGIGIQNLPTCFGELDLSWRLTEHGATLRLGARARPPDGCLLCLPEELQAQVHGKEMTRDNRGAYWLPPGVDSVSVVFE